MSLYRKLEQSLRKDISRDSFIHTCQAQLQGVVGKEDWARVFEALDKDGDGKLSEDEVERGLQTWLRPLSQPRAALLIVDFQNDFISGSLSVGAGPAKQDPLEAIAQLNSLLKKDSSDFSIVVYTLDWHPSDHISFHDNLPQRPLAPKHRNSEPALFETICFEEPAVEQTLWPRHCVQNSWGSQLHPDLFISPNSLQVQKGYHSETDSYSAFFDNNKSHATELDQILRKHDVTHVLVCGLAYDVCVGATAADALSLGYRTAIIEDCTKGLDLQAIEKERSKLRKDGCGFFDSCDIPRILQGETICSEWITFLPSV